MHNKPDELRLLTWNVWFHTLAQSARMTSILNLIQEHNPDIIGLQELTLQGLQTLEAPHSPLLQYHKVKSEVAQRQSYWEGIYSRFQPGPLSQRVPYEWTHMGRGLTILHCPTLDLVVGTTHLESMDRSQFRAAQILEAFERIDSFGTQNAILMGDTNLYQPETIKPLPQGWTDSWNTLYPNQHGWTRNSQINPMIEYPTQERLDRIFLRTNNFVPQQILILGTKPCQTITKSNTQNNTTIFPSDHFGLLLQLKRIQSETTQTTLKPQSETTQTTLKPQSETTQATPKTTAFWFT